ncbi:MAG: hypothetical protein V7717_09640 [Porticoccaceae bacterium]
MKKIFFINGVLIVVLGMSPLLATAEEWYEGGVLHSATVDDWNSADASNKLATAADWASIRPKVQDKLKKSGDIATLRRFSNKLVKCTDRATQGKGYGHNPVLGLAEGCMLLMGW